MEQHFLPHDLQVMERGFFVGWSLLVCIVVMLQALGGVIVATVAKYADNVSKGFSSAASLVCTCMISSYLFQWRPSPAFVVGAGLVCAAIYLYAKPKPEHEMPYVPVSMKELEVGVEIVEAQRIPGGEERS